jgi:hypothetical protein
MVAIQTAAKIAAVDFIELLPGGFYRERLAEGAETTD